MSRRRQIYEGKAKILYEGPEPGTLFGSHWGHFSARISDTIGFCGEM